MATGSASAPTLKESWNLPHMALLLASGGKLLRANAGLARLYPEIHDAVGSNWAEALGLDDAAGAAAWLAEAAGGAARVESARGGARWLRLRVLGGGVVAGDAAVEVEDVTREHAEIERMRREGAHFHALIERSAEGISIFDVQAKILYESPSNKRIHGYDAHEMEGRNLFDFCHPEDMARVMPRFVHLAEGPGVVETDIVRFRHKAGHYIYLEGTVLNATDDPRVNGLVNNFRDVTARLDAERELRRAKEAAEQAQRMQQHFLTNLSHEFKTPLTLIRGPLADLAADEIAPERRAEAWRLVGRNVERLDALLTELIDLARLEAGVFSLRARRHDLADFARRQTTWFAEQAAARGIELRLDSPATCEAFFDAAKLEKVLGNLIGNALKFSPSGTTVRVTLRRVPGLCFTLGRGDDAVEDGVDEGKVELSVRDEGPGMDEATRARVFERFFQGDMGPARGHEGMGIGLAIARELTEMHGGFLSVASEPGRGSTFTLSLPLGCGHLDPDDIDTSVAPEPRPHGVGSAGFASNSPPILGRAPAAPGEAARPRLLLVEDNFDMRLYLRLLLDPHYAVSEAANGAEALEALARESPDIVLSDVMMPRMDGLELCRRLRADARLAALPVVLLSAKGLADQRAEGLKAGADDYVAKPFSIAELLQRLRARLPRANSTPKASAEGAGEARTWPARLEACVDEHLSSVDFGVEALARRMGYSSRQLGRRVLELLGTTPEAYILDRRLRRARDLIAERRFETQAEVAHAVGLSPGYFSRRYRQVFPAQSDSQCARD